MEDYLYDVYMLCPVRNATKEEKGFLENYRDQLLSKGLKVLYPAIDTKQEGQKFAKICYHVLKDVA